MIRKVPLTEVLKNLDGSCDYDDFDGSPERWQELIYQSMTDGQGAYVLHSIMEEGQLDPINIVGDLHCQGNGHHRLAALILLGADEILVDDSSWYSHDSDAHRHDEEDHWLRDRYLMPNWCYDDTQFFRDTLDFPEVWADELVNA